MRQHHRVQPVEPHAQRLGPEIRCGIDHHILSAAREQQGRAQPLVVRVGRIANRAVTPSVGTPMLVPEPMTVMRIFSAAIPLLYPPRACLGHRHGSSP